MKKRRAHAFLVLSGGLIGLSLFQGACQSVGYYRGERAPSMASPTRMAAVERAWNARFEYDHDRRLLIPKHNGTRWGAVQEFKEDSTIVFREWRVRDVKLEDLEASPATDVVQKQEKEPDFIPNANEFGVAPTEVASPAPPTALPPIGLPPVEPPVATGLPELPSVPGGPPGFEPLPEAGGGVTPFQMAPLDALPAGPGPAAPSPFAPLPGALPEVGLPGAPAAPGGLNPLAPVPGGIPAPAPMVPGGAAPAPANPFGPPPGGAPGDPVPANPFGAPVAPAPAAPGDNPFAP